MNVRIHDVVKHSLVSVLAHVVLIFVTSNIYLSFVSLKAHPVNVAAVFPYESKCQENLSFQEGDIITLLEAR